jgi:hypothetical protein
MSGILEVAIGLGGVYLLFSAITSSLVEWMSAAFDRRSKNLLLSLELILGRELRQRLLAHPAIGGIVADTSSNELVQSGFRLWWPKRTPPNYLSPRSVALALADLARTPHATNDRLARLFDSFKAPADAEVLFRLEKWFTEQMDRTTGQYKRWTQVMTLAVAIVLTAVFDLDTLRIGSELYRNTTVRSAVADQVAEQLKGKSLDQIDLTLKQFSTLPIGWKASRWTDSSGLAALAGWLISVIALGLGAPFWFDLVGRLINLRQSGPRPTEGQFVAQ